MAAPVVTQSFAVKSPTKTDQTITFAVLSNKTLGDLPFGLTATASSGLAVSFIAQTPGVCTIASTTVTLVAPGICSIQAIQNGDVTYNPATPVTQPFTVSPGKLSQTITFAALLDRTLGDPAFTLDATASSGLSVSFNSQTAGVCTVSGNTVTLVAVGTCTILAAQAGNPT